MNFYIPHFNMFEPLVHILERDVAVEFIKYIQQISQILQLTVKQYIWIRS